MCVTSYLTYGISPGFTRPSSSRAFCSSFLGSCRSCFFCSSSSFHPSAGPCPAVSHAPAFSAEQSDNSGCLVQRCIRILKRRKRISASRCPEKGASEKAFSSYYACGALYARASLPSTWFTNLYTLGSAAISASYFSLALAARNP